jgi:hypothetical protein
LGRSSKALRTTAHEAQGTHPDRDPLSRERLLAPEFAMDSRRTVATTVSLEHCLDLDIEPTVLEFAGARWT